MLCHLRRRATRRGWAGGAVSAKLTTRSAVTAISPKGCGGMGTSSALPLLEDDMASTSSRRLEYAPMPPQRAVQGVSGRASSIVVPQLVQSCPGKPSQYPERRAREEWDEKANPAQYPRICKARRALRLG
jgi:hypothetical protein